jgi:hypothetical protein
MVGEERPALGHPRSLTDHTVWVVIEITRIEIPQQRRDTGIARPVSGPATGTMSPR